MCCSNSGFCYAACAVRFTIRSTDGKFHPVSNLQSLHALTLAAHSYAFFILAIHIFTRCNMQGQTKSGLTKYKTIQLATKIFCQEK